MNISGWILSITAMIIVIFANYPLQQQDQNISPVVYGLYDAISRLAWSIALCYIIFACVCGSGGVVNRFLSHPFWLPLSRLSYAIYLLHPFVIIMRLGTQKISPHFSETAAVMIIISKKIFFYTNFLLLTVQRFYHKLLLGGLCVDHGNISF